jgi:prepilin peptidase CpaA
LWIPYIWIGSQVGEESGCTSGGAGRAGMLKPFLISFVLVAALFDLRWRRIPNWLNLTGWIFGMVLQFYTSGLEGVGQGLMGTAVALAVYGTLFALRAMGGGDVKLMGAVGAFTGPLNWFSVFLTAALMGGFIGLVSVFTRGEFTRVGRNMAVVVWELVHLRAPHKASAELDVASPQARTLPHGVAIAVGTVLWALYTASR